MGSGWVPFQVGIPELFGADLAPGWCGEQLQ